tara:strand:- start:16555 stop:17460 length:906 start_codon:yes stop_codon:yes gene_type:complete
MLKALILSLSLFGLVQGQELPKLPPFFDYQLRTDSMMVQKYREGAYSIERQENILQIGCREEINAEVAFSLSLSNNFLFEEYPKMMAGKWVDYHPKGLKLILYGVKKKGGSFDSIFEARIEDYCVYGQHNYLTSSKDYFIFTYQYAMNGGGSVKGYEDMGLWQEFIEGFTDWLDTAPLKGFHLKAFSEDSLIGSDFNWKGEYRVFPYDSVKVAKDLNELVGRTIERKNSSRLVKLKNRDKAESISNFREPEANWYIYKAKWWRRQNLIYVWVEGLGLEVYRISAPGVMVQLKHGFVLVKSS